MKTATATKPSAAALLLLRDCARTRAAFAKEDAEIARGPFAPGAGQMHAHLSWLDCRANTAAAWRFARMSGWDAEATALASAAMRAFKSAGRCPAPPSRPAKTPAGVA